MVIICKKWVEEKLVTTCFAIMLNSRCHDAASIERYMEQSILSFSLDIALGQRHVISCRSLVYELAGKEVHKGSRCQM